ncbi:MAG: hypothetical protein Q4G59_09205, partial [Planctomycetia bacterium]|nr:hypothetical protein [Planctomycetia bacterium]
MKSSVKHERGKNDLELILTKCYQYLKDNQEKVMGFICLLVVAGLIVVVARYYMSRDTSVLQAQVDEAYYQATNKSLLSGDTAPDPVPFESLAKTCKAGLESAVIRISAGEAHMKAGIAAIDARIAASEEAPKAPIGNPADSFDKAVEAFKLVMNAHTLGNPDLTARSIYDQGIVAEYRARIAASDKDVDDQLASAAKLYGMVIEKCAGTPFAEAAQDRLTSIGKPITVAYYKKIANQYKTLPAPKPIESILPPTSGDPLSPKSQGDMKAIDEFSVSGAKPADAKADAKKEVPKADATKPADAAKTEAPKTADAKADAKK